MLIIIIVITIVVIIISAVVVVWSKRDCCCERVGFVYDHVRVKCEARLADDVTRSFLPKMKENKIKN